MLLVATPLASIIVLSTAPTAILAFVTFPFFILVVVTELICNKFSLICPALICADIIVSFVILSPVTALSAILVVSIELISN